VLLVVWCLMTPFSGVVSGAGLQAGAPDPSEPTAIEEALIEHACSATRAPRALDTNAYGECLSTQLRSLRADLGHDLGGLSAAERKTLDVVCGDFRVSGGRDAYLDCLFRRLVTLRSQRNRAKPPDETALAPPAVSAPAASSAPPARRASS
jgi:hypothetical protein